MREGWKYKKLSDCCEVLNGFAFKSDKYVEAGTRVIRITNVQKGYIVDDDPKYYPDDEMSHLGQYCLYENDLLMSLTGNVGRVGLLQKEMLPAALNQRVACLRIKGRDISLRYLFHCLNSVVFEQKAIYSATGIAQKNMSTEWLKKYEIPVPSISEQERIVAELDCLSGVIEKQKQQLKELDNLIQAIFYDMFGDPITNVKGWNTSAISEHCEILNGFAFKSDKYTEIGTRVMRITNVQKGFVIDNDPKYYPDCEMQGLKQYVLKENDLLMSLTGNVGRVGLMTKALLPAALNQRVACLRIKDCKILLKYLFHLLNSNAFEEKAIYSATGIAQKNMSTEWLKKYRIPIPPLSLQQEFASKIEAIEKQKELIKQSLSETETLFNSRMDYYFN